jgi:uncharacterized protein YukE
MSPSLRPTEEQVAAAQLRVEVDKKLGRATPDAVREIAAYHPTSDLAQPRQPLVVADTTETPQGGVPTVAAHVAAALREQGYHLTSPWEGHAAEAFRQEFEATRDEWQRAAARAEESSYALVDRLEALRYELEAIRVEWQRAAAQAEESSRSE